MKINTRYVLGSVLLSFSILNTAHAQIFQNLRLGSRGEQVRSLQIILNKDKETQVSAYGAGSKGSENNYFGGKTVGVLQCLCSQNQLVYVNDAATGRTLAFLYDEKQGSKLTPGSRLEESYLLGSYSRTIALCLLPGTPCPVIVLTGIIDSNPGAASS
jgi:hypothetical protein